ncbi:MAG: TonB-dependent siderophore receptor, partial [Pseudomonas sp.]
MGTRVLYRDTPGLPIDTAVPHLKTSRKPLATLIHGVALGLSLTQMNLVQAAEADTDHALVLDSSVVTGTQADSPTGQQAGYVAKRSLSGTKTDTALNEIPQSISVVT